MDIEEQKLEQIEEQRQDKDKEQYKLAKVIEEYPVYIKTCSKCVSENVKTNTIREKIMLFLTTNGIDNIFFIQTFNLHACMYLTKSVDIDVILLSLDNFFNYNFELLQIYITCIVNSINKLSNLSNKRYQYMDKIIMISESVITKDFTKLSDDIILTCQLKQHKSLYIKLFVRCIESLMEWSLGIRGYIQQSSLKNCNGHAFEYLDHDWMKICNHGIFICQMECQSLDNQENKYRNNAPKTVRFRLPPRLKFED